MEAAPKRNSQVCSNCILVDSVPGISFDEKGVCNFCREYWSKEKRQVEQKNYTILQEELVKTLRTNSRRHIYDCLCLYSGGKDSTYMLYFLVKKLKLRVLAFTFDNYFIAPECIQNMNRVLTKLNVDHVLFKPSWEKNKSYFRTAMLHADMTEKAKELAYMIGHACWPCYTQISIQSFLFAVEKNIPHIVVGTTPGQLRQRTYDQARYSSLFDVYRIMIRPMLHLLKVANNQVFNLPFLFYLKIFRKLFRMKLVPFYEYIRYSEREVLEVIQKELDWRKPTSTDSCSTNCQLNTLGIQIHKNKYGISPYMIPLARDVREGLVDRAEALSTLEADLNINMANRISEKLDVHI